MEEYFQYFIHYRQKYLNEYISSRRKSIFLYSLYTLLCTYFDTWKTEVFSIFLQERRSMIVPIGLEKKRVIFGCKLYPINVVYLLHNPIKVQSDSTQSNALPGVIKYSEDFAKGFKKEIKDDFTEILDEEAELNSFSSSIRTLNKIYSNELEKPNFSHIYINISTASKAFAIAAYVFGCNNSENVTLFYLKTKQYILLDYLEKDSSIVELRKKFLECGLTDGPYESIVIPLIRTVKYTENELKLMKTLAKKPKFNSLKELIEKSDFVNTPADRIRVRRILYSFEEEGLVKIKSVMRNSEISITKKFLGLIDIVL